MKCKEFITQKMPAALKTAAKKTWAYIKLARIELIVLAAILALDLITKGIVKANMREGEEIVLIRNFLSLHYVVNTRAAFSSTFGLEEWLGLEGVRIVFLIFTSVALIFFFYFMVYFRKQRKLARVTFAMIIAGTLGNYFDRLFNWSTVYKAFGVRDFIKFSYFGGELFGSTYFPIFNVADMSLVFGVALFAVFFIFMYKPDKPELVGPVFQPDYQPDFQLEDKADSTPEKLKAESAEVTLTSPQTENPVSVPEKVLSVPENPINPESPKNVSEQPGGTQEPAEPAVKTLESAEIVQEPAVQESNEPDAPQEEPAVKAALKTTAKTAKPSVSAAPKKSVAPKTAANPKAPAEKTSEKTAPAKTTVKKPTTTAEKPAVKSTAATTAKTAKTSKPQEPKDG